MHNLISKFLLFLDTFILEPLHSFFLPLQFGFVLFGLNQNLDVQLMWRPWHPNFSIKIVCFFEIGSVCLTKAPRRHVNETKFQQISKCAVDIFFINCQCLYILAVLVHCRVWPLPWARKGQGIWRRAPIILWGTPPLAFGQTREESCEVFRQSTEDPSYLDFSDSFVET